MAFTRSSQQVFDSSSHVLSDHYRTDLLARPARCVSWHQQARCGPVQQFGYAACSSLEADSLMKMRIRMSRHGMRNVRVPHAMIAKMARGQCQMVTRPPEHHQHQCL